MPFAAPSPVFPSTWATPSPPPSARPRPPDHLHHFPPLRPVLGPCDRLVRILNVLGLVKATPDFGDHPEVINGCSDLLVDVFGEAGKHARSAVGMGSLPGGIPVEIEVILEFE